MDEFNFPTLNMDWAKSKAGEPQANTEETNDKEELRFVFMPKVGSIQFHVLPPDDQGRLGIYVYKHWQMPYLDKHGDVQIGNQVCVKKTWPELNIRCPICDMIDDFKRVGFHEDDYSDYFASGKAYVGATIQSGKDHEDKDIANDEPVVFGMNEYSLDWMLQQAMNPMIGNFYSPTKGNIIEFSRASVNDKWTRKIFDEPHALASNTDDIRRIIENRPQMYDVFTPPSERGMEGIIQSAEMIKEQVKMSRGLINKSVPNKNPETDRPAEKAIEQAKQDVKKDAESRQLPPVYENNQSADTRTVEQLHSETAQNLSNAKPSGAPVCFGSSIEYDDTSMKCLACPHALECQNKIDGSAALKDDDIPF